jgi:hypothetical protein
MNSPAAACLVILRKRSRARSERLPTKDLCTFLAVFPAHARSQDREGHGLSRAANRRKNDSGFSR